jgi:hypothetical protein
MREHDFEPVRGLPEKLPQGERILWQGSTDWLSFAVRVFHLRFVAGYFALVLAWTLFAGLWEGLSAAAMLNSAMWLSLAAIMAIGVLCGLAALFARSTVYTITNRRIVMRYGVAIPMTINLPFKTIVSAGLRTYGDGTGDIPVKLNGDGRLAYLHLWPNARPWYFSKAEPMLRSVPEAERVAALLSQALAEVSAGEPVKGAFQPSAAAPARQVAEGGKLAAAAR